jgi:hypothetical protein
MRWPEYQFPWYVTMLNTLNSLDSLPALRDLLALFTVFGVIREPLERYVFEHFPNPSQRRLVAWLLPFSSEMTHPKSTSNSLI